MTKLHGKRMSRDARLGGPLADGSHHACFLQAAAEGTSRFELAHLRRKHGRMLLAADNGVRHRAVQAISRFTKGCRLLRRSFQQLARRIPN